MTYSEQAWVDDVSVADAAALNHMEQGISAAHLLASAHPGYDYTIIRSGNTYTAVSRTGSTVSGTDVASPAHSGLVEVLDAVAADGVSIFFPAGTYSFPEDPNGVEDHWAVVGINNLSLVGVRGATILSNWRDDSQGGYDTNPDTEPFSFTRCHGLLMKGFRVWHGGNQDANNSSDACDFDGCRGIVLEDIIVERSRARGIVYDGGDQGAVSPGSIIRDCKVQGIPGRPGIRTGAAGSMTSQEYRYVITFVDSVYGETPPSDIGSFVHAGTTQLVLDVPTGPAYSSTKGVTARKIYRWSAAQPTYRLLTTINNNTTTTHSDNASDASISSNAQPPTAGKPLVPMEGIKVLGAQGCEVRSSQIHGVGSHGIQVVRKGSGASTVQANRNVVNDNVVRFAGIGTTTSGIAGIYLGGANGNVVQGNHITNSGTISQRGYGIRLQGLTSATCDDNLIGPNLVMDDQDANAPSGGVTTQYGVHIASTPAPDGNVVFSAPAINMFTGEFNDAGTNTRAYTPA